MRIKIWTMTTDTDDGLQTQLFVYQKTRDNAIFSWLAERDEAGRTAGQIDEEFEGDIFLAGEEIQNGEDFLNLDDHEIEAPSPAPVVAYELRYVCRDDDDVQSFATLDELPTAGMDSLRYGIYSRPTTPDAAGICPLTHVADFEHEVDATTVLGLLQRVHETPLRVKIEVSGGNAHVTECDDGVDVEIVDHDNERNG